DARLEGRFREAALLAGFDSVDFVYEPVAASVDALDGGRGRGTVLVFDFGGGTLDISVARGGERGVEILSSAGMDLGGYLLNEDLARARIVGHFGAGGKWRTMTGRWLEMPAWITNQVASFYALPLADLQRTRTTVKELVYDARREDKDKLRGLVEFLDRNLAFELFARIDGAKIELSGAEESSIAYAVPPYIEFEERLARADFEALVAPRVEAARLLVLEALAKAGVEAGRVDRVVRVGGSSRVPAFVRMLEGLFSGRVEEGAVFTSIASGLIAARDRGLVAGA
ncbi:MAG TPA: Hsp70 family protein, partial [Spirochaetales bacterium]|nr:Hsp70 family protein [Spirochaetales bacterium]